MTKIAAIRERLLGDLATQQLAHSPFLPASKELAIHYGISQPTLRKLLGQLVEDHHLERVGARYQIPPFSSKSNAQSYIQVIMGADNQGLRMETPREMDFFRNLLQLTKDNHLGLQVIGVEDWKNGPSWRKEDGSVDGSRNPAKSPLGLVGTILSSWHLRDVRNILARLSQVETNAPIAVWMEESGVEKWLTGKQPGTRKRITKFFDVAYGKSPGKLVAKFLQEEGLKKVAFLSPFHKSSWSLDRYDAISKELQSSGGSVYPYTSDLAISPWDFRHEVENSPDFQQTRDSFLNLLRPAHISERMIQELDNSFTETYRNQSIASLLLPFFQDALSKSFQAWVCVNDLIALFAYDFLKQAGIPKKKQPRLIGFDNLPATYTRGISSLEPGTAELVRSMIEYLQRPRHPAFAHRNLIRIAGQMYAR